MGRHKNGKIIKCEYCGKDNYYSLKRLEYNEHHFCNPHCWGKFREQQLEIPNTRCHFCNKNFYLIKSRQGKFKYNFCCKKCHYEFQLSENNPLRVNHPTICLQCGNTFNKRHNKRQNKFCNQDCYSKFLIFQGAILQPIQPSFKVEKKCHYCHKIYKIPRYRKETSEFCSKKCHFDAGRFYKTCPVCKSEFATKRNVNKKYCSQECARKGNDIRNTKFVIEIKNFLNKSQISFQEENLIKFKTKKYFADFLIKKNKIIECFGDYWHCNPIKYQPNYFHPQIRKMARNIWKRDKDRIKHYTSNGLITLIVWERDWKKDLVNTQDKILKFINNP